MMLSTVNSRRLSGGCTLCNGFMFLPHTQARTRVKLNFMDNLAKFWELQVRDMRYAIFGTEGCVVFFV